MIVHCAHDALVDPDDLPAHPKNRNKHPADQIKRLAQILTYQGWRYPVKVSKRSGFVTSGHGRIEAARLNGWATVPVNYQDYDSDEQEYADVQADNAIASWAEIDLSGINTDIGDLGPDFDIDMLGMENFELVIGDTLEPQCDEDEVPEFVEPKTRLGDIYQLGKHRLMCGDSTSIDAVEKLMAGEKAELCFTSPPYNIGRLNANGDVGQKYENDTDDKSEDEYEKFLSDITSNMLMVSRYVLVNLQILAKNRIALSNFQHQFKEFLKDILIWVKDTAAPNINRGTFGSRWEYVFAFANTDDARTRCFDVDWQGKFFNVVQGPSAGNENEFSKIHRATFPAYLPEWFIEKLTNTGDKVVDCFGGSGTTMIACEKTNRRCFMMELDPKYCDVIVARWEKYTGKKAALLTEATDG